MARVDDLAVMAYLAGYHKSLSETYAALEQDTTRAGKSRRAAIGKDMDRLLKLYQSLKKSTDRAVKTVKEEPSILVGVCPCGEDVLIGERYSLSVKTPTTIRRKCQKCSRVNAVSMGISKEFVPASWHAFDCRCGAAINVRGDYAGPFFAGSHVRRLFAHDEEYKNRTTKVDCPECPCKWVIKIVFSKGEDGKRSREIILSVYRCKPCQVKVNRSDSYSADSRVAT